ncbi:MAG: tetratricopeptide repeat protein, partial [Hamadaea sp.]|nr:tetratricopeptide repeat protein [Hamadaea sp.]
QGIEAAEALLERALHRDPTFAGAIAARGYTSWRKYFAGWADSADALGRALRDVEAALGADPESIMAHVTYVRACWDMGWHERALDAGRSIFLRNPESLDAALAFARALTNAGLADAAMPLVASVLADVPLDLTALKLRIWCLMLLGRAGDAVEAATTYLGGHPADANTRWAVALAAYHLGDAEQALRVARAAAEADPQDVTAWTLLGYLHRLSGDPEQARGVWLDGLARLAPETVASSRRAAWLANILAAAGDEAAALSFAGQLRATQPGNGYILYRLSHVYAELNRTEEALDTLRAAVDSGFLSVQLLRREQDFGLAGIRCLDAYGDLLRRLDDNVERCRRSYAADLPAVLARPGGTER